MQLAIDGCGNFLDISIFNKEELVYTLFLRNNRTHSQQLIEVIDNILDKLQTNINGIKDVYCVTGPGRYTSIRVVISTIKGLFFKKEINVYSLNSLDLTAVSVCELENFRIVGDFFSKEAYYCDYTKKNRIVKRVSEIKKGKKEEVKDTNLPIIETGNLHLFPKTPNIFKVNHIKKEDIFSLNPFY